MTARALLVLLALVLAAPLAAAQGGVRVVDVELPERTLAGRPFEARVTLRNDGEALNVTLLAALYRHAEGKQPCGPASGPAFRTYTHLVQESVRLPKDATVVYPDPDERWLQRYGPDHVEAGDRLEEWCVFVARQASTAAIDYQAYASERLRTRGVNEPPAASMEVPEFIEAARPAQFRASASDPEGDPVTFRWDFGHLNATGRAVAEGPAPVHRFYPEGSYVVTLVASDGFDEARIEQSVEALPEGSAPVDTRPQQRTPVPALLAPAAILLALALRRFR